jgi:hypothetical protein
MMQQPQGYWEGQVIPDAEDNETDTSGHGFRVKVRIFFSTLPNGKGVDSVDATITNKDLRYATIIMPTTHGTKNRLSHGIRGGENVCGYFMDPEGQIPRITGVLARTNTGTLLASNAKDTTNGQIVATYTQDRANSTPTARTGGAAPSTKESAAGTGVNRNLFAGVIPNMNNSIKMN